MRALGAGQLQDVPPRVDDDDDDAVTVLSRELLNLIPAAAFAVVDDPAASFSLDREAVLGCSALEAASRWIYTEAVQLGTQVVGVHLADSRLPVPGLCLGCVDGLRRAGLRSIDGGDVAVGAFDGQAGRQGWTAAPSLPP